MSSVCEMLDEHKVHEGLKLISKGLFTSQTQSLQRGWSVMIHSINVVILTTSPLGTLKMTSPLLLMKGLCC